MMRGPRYAEELFPMKEVSEISSKEKSIRHGHISTLHIWWARRPLSISRAINFASMIEMPEESQLQNTKELIIKLSKWENSSDKTLLERVTSDILKANGGRHPKVLDPFAGGGSIPLESLRLGCETYASDYNPVSTLLLKCTLEFPQMYRTKGDNSKSNLVEERKIELLEEVKKWGEWVLSESKKELSKFYYNNNDVPVAYIWVKNIPCQNPACVAEIPLFKQFWLAKRDEKKISIYPYIYRKQVKFKLVGTGFEKIPKDFNPDKGTVARAIATCLVCGSVVDNKTTARLFREKKSNHRLVAIITYKKGINGKNYRVASPNDINQYNDASNRMSEKREQIKSRIGIDPIPDEPTPDGKGRGAERAFSVRNYGMNTWGDLFNSRQLLALITFIEKIRNAYDLMISSGYEKDYARAITTYLALCLDRVAVYNSTNAPWHTTGEKATQVFGRQTLSMVWDYAEINPLGESFSWITQLEWILKNIDHLSKIPVDQKIFVRNHSATELPYADGYFDAVFTDPPYYDNVPYSHLSDFFYVWLKRSIGDLYPDLFSTPLTPKSKEIVAYSNIEGGFEAGKNFFENMLKKSFLEISRVLKPNGISVIVYAHKSTAGWETLINSLLDSGLVVTAAWPINTEMKERLRAAESAALASSIYMVAGKYPKLKFGFLRDIKDELKAHLTRELNKLWVEGISGADFFISAIGSAIEVFGKYETITDDAGNQVKADKMLAEIRRMVTDYAVKQVLHNGFGAEISNMTRLYVLWRWAYGEAKIHFDDARKLSQSVGVDITSIWNKGFIQKENEFIRLLGPSERNNREVVDSKEMVDVLHSVLHLWNSGKSKEIVDHLEATGFRNSDVFYRVAQAISESLPIESKEKKWLEGFLAGRARITKQMTINSTQRRLFE